MGYKDKPGQDSGGVLGNQELGQRPLVGHRLAIILGQPAAQLQPHRKNGLHIPKNPGHIDFTAHEVGLREGHSGIERLGPSSQSSGVASESKSSPTGLIGVSAGLAQQRRISICVVPLSPFTASEATPFYFFGGHHAETTH